MNVAIKLDDPDDSQLHRPLTAIATVYAEPQRADYGDDADDTEDTWVVSGVRPSEAFAADHEVWRLHSLAVRHFIGGGA